MPLVLGKPGFDMTIEERVGYLVAAAGGPVRAAELTGKARGTVDNWRKPGTSLPLVELLPLCREAGVSLDWLATGYQVRSDLQRIDGMHEDGVPQSGTASTSAGYIPVAPLKPTPGNGAGVKVERFAPSDLAVSETWLTARGLAAGALRFARLDDDGMAPLLGKGAVVFVDTRPSKPRSGLYLAQINDELLARRLQAMPGNSLELVADANPRWHYAISGNDPTDLAKLGVHRIVWAGQDL